jgi:hypothetical protein
MEARGGKSAGGGGEGMSGKRSWPVLVVVAAILLPYLGGLGRTDRTLVTMGGVLMWWYIRWEMRGWGDD